MTRPTGLKVGARFQSATEKKMRPMQTEKAHMYSMLEKILRFMMVAMSMVGTSLQDRKTTLVGKLM